MASRVATTMSSTHHTTKARLLKRLSIVSFASPLACSIFHGRGLAVIAATSRKDAASEHLCGCWPDSKKGQSAAASRRCWLRSANRIATFSFLSLASHFHFFSLSQAAVSQRSSTHRSLSPSRCDSCRQFCCLCFCCSCDRRTEL